MSSRLSRKVNKVGVCQLTGSQGKMAKCHLIPLAFTKPEIAGRPLIQIAAGEPSTRRRTSWYDPNLVTTVGEALLGEIDNWGIAFLRKKRLVWSGWPSTNLSSVLDGDENYRRPNTRAITVEDPKRLRLFFVSLLWRACATSLKDFEEAEVPKADLERLRCIVTGQIEDDPLFYACNLFQLTTIGPIHNVTPIRRTFDERNAPAGAPKTVLRFYFDGLIVWFNLAPLPEDFSESEVILGASNRNVFRTHPFEGSWSHSNMQAVIRATYVDFVTRFPRVLR